MSKNRMTTAQALEHVRLERSYQDRRWGVNDYPLPVWLMILSEEFGEVASLCETAFFQPRKADLDKLRSEPIQVAAVAVAMAESLEVVEGSPECAAKLDDKPGDWRLFWVGEETEIYIARSPAEAKAYAEEESGEVFPDELVGEVTEDRITEDDGNRHSLFEAFEADKADGIERPRQIWTGH